MKDTLICRICNVKCVSLKGLSQHLAVKHNYSKQIYYNLYFKTNENEHLCKICGKPSNFINLGKGYRETCNEPLCIKLKKEQTCIEKYGVSHSSASPIVQEKREKTCLEKYGHTHHMKDDKVKCHQKQIFIDKYGVDNPAKLESTQNKMQQTCLEKYGVEHASQNQNIQNKSKNTCLEKYGVEYSFQSENNKNKSINTCLDKYGVEYYFQTDEFQEKFKNTNLDRYGVEYPLQSEEKQKKFKQTCLEKYGVENPNQVNYIKEKKKESYLEKYGVDNYFKSVEFLSKEIKEYSKISQELFWKIYEQLPEYLQKECYFAELNRERFLNYKGQGFMYDFCILSKKLFIEFNGDYWHRNPKFYEATEENLKIWKKDEFKKQVAEEQGFQIFYIWENEYNKNKKDVIKYCLNFILAN